MKTIKISPEDNAIHQKRPDWLPFHLFPFESRFMRYEGNEIHYIDEGTGPVLLFSHPAVAWTFMYRNFITHLKDQFRCVAIDYPGFGLSATKANGAITLRSQADALEALIEHLALKEITILGHDTGGPTAFFLASCRPELFKAFILTDTLIFPASDYRRISVMLSMLNSPVIRYLNSKTNFLMRLTTRFGFPTAKLKAEERQVYLKSFSSSERRNQIITLLHDLKKDKILMQQVQHAFEQQFKNDPILLIYGEEDPVVQMGVFQRIQAIVSNCEAHLIKKEGHFPHEGKAIEMTRIIENWMHKINNPKSKGND